MSMEPSEYRKLPGRRGRFFAYHLLYLGDDHLLGIHCRFFTEYYKRYYLKDIQAIVCQRSGRGPVWTVILAVVGLLFLVPIFVSKMDAHPFWFIAAVCVALILIVHILKGPTSDCYLRTAVQMERLPSLGRLRQANRVLDRLIPLIDGVQGRLEPDKIEASDLYQPPAEAIVDPLDMAGKPLRHESGRIHQALFVWMGIEALSTGLRFLTSHLAAIIAGQMVAVVLPILTIIAIVKQTGSDLGGGIKGVTWASGAYSILNFLVGYVIYMVLILDDPQKYDDPWSFYHMAVETGPEANDVMMTVYILFLTTSLLLTILGLVFLARRPAAGSVEKAASKSES